MSNPFEALAERQTPAPVKRRNAQAQARAAAKIEQQDETTLLMKWYRDWRREQREDLASGPQGEHVAPILSFLRTMTLDSAPALLGMFEGADWIDSMSMPHRYTLLHLVGHGIVRCREKGGLPPFDDGIPWVEDRKAFHVLKERLGCS